MNWKSCREHEPEDGKKYLVRYCCGSDGINDDFVYFVAVFMDKRFVDANGAGLYTVDFIDDFIEIKDY